MNYILYMYTKLYVLLLHNPILKCNKLETYHHIIRI